MRQAVQERLAPKANGTGTPGSQVNIGEMINQISGTSISQTETLIGELERIRNFLLSEGHRIQDEVTQYARLNHRALESTRVITETLQTWRQGPDPVAMH
jgi:hypothetical protein